MMIDPHTYAPVAVSSRALHPFLMALAFIPPRRVGFAAPGEEYDRTRIAAPRTVHSLSSKPPGFRHVPEAGASSANLRRSRRALKRLSFTVFDGLAAKLVID